MTERPAERSVDLPALDARYRDTVVAFVLEAARQWPGQTALHCGDQSLSYRAYADRIIELARRLGGLDTSVRVATLLPNGIAACVAHFGVLAAGAQLLPMNPAYTARELAFQLNDAECQVVIADPQWRKTIEPLARNSGADVIWFDGTLSPDDQTLGPGAETRSARGETDRACERLPDRVDPQALAILQYTGGTSGRPKGVDLTHAALYTNVVQREAVLPTRQGAETILCAMPLFHSYAMAMGLYMGARCAATLVILPAFHREPFFDAIEAHRVTLLPGSPSIYVALMAHPRFATTDWSSLRMGYSGSAALPVAVLRRWEETVKAPIFEGYGMTEAGPVLSFNGPLRPAKAGSVGQPLPQTEIEIVDLQTGRQRLPAHHCGEIRVRGPQLMQGYRNRPAETAIALRDGWLYTGDLGEFDGDGDLFIRGRRHDLIIVGGYNVYPREIEEVLLEHPSVLEAAVVGAPDGYRGEVLHAFVVTRSGPIAGHEALLAAHCAGHLARYKHPTHYHWTDALPRTSVNKIDRRALARSLVDQATGGDTTC